MEQKMRQGTLRFDGVPPRPQNGKPNLGPQHATSPPATPEIDQGASTASRTTETRPRHCGDRAPVGQAGMNNLLTDPLIRMRLVDGRITASPLPTVYEELGIDRVAAFPALRPHQRHAWHAFLAQLGVIAMHRSGETTPPRTAVEWNRLLRNLTPEFTDDEPWRLVAADPARPAFMQCPALEGLGDYKTEITSPDDLEDVPISSKNHEVKRTAAFECGPDDWIFALVDLQTTAGYLGAGKYGISRMNGGFSTRSFLGLARDGAGPGGHIFDDMERMLTWRRTLLETYEEYYKDNYGVALLWLEPWDGKTSLGLGELDPYFVEICRRVRLRCKRNRLVAQTAPSKAARVAAKNANGNLGDFWTPIREEDAKAFSLSRVGFRYDRLAKLLIDRKSFRLPPSLEVETPGTGRWRLIARGVAAGQGKTDGYHERNDVVFERETTNALRRHDERDALARTCDEQIEEVGEIAKALTRGIAVAASRGQKPSGGRSHAAPYLRRLDDVVDSQFFPALERRFLASDDTERAARRAEFAQTVINSAKELLEHAVRTAAGTGIYRYRAQARAYRAFWGRLRSPSSVFSDQPEIFPGQEDQNAG